MAWGRVFAVVCAVGGLALVAWFSHHPESPWLRRAAGWPVVGPVAESFRRAYLGPETAPAAPPAEAVPDPAPESEWGDRSVRFEVPDYERFGPRPWVDVRPGDEVRAAPEPGAEVLHRFSSYANPRILDRRGDWFHVRFRTVRGWMYVPHYRPPPSPRSEPDVAPVLPVEEPPADERRLAAARALLGDAREAQLGAWPLLTDLEPGPRLRLLDAVAAGLEAAYESRYGVRPVGSPAATIVAFSEDADYRAFRAGANVPENPQSSGHVELGLVAIVGAGHQPFETAAVLVHELVHLLNRRAIGPALPLWLEEGLAEDLSESRIRPDGTIELGTLGGMSLSGGRGDYLGGGFLRGGLASAAHVRELAAEGELPSLAAFVEVDNADFVARASHYYPLAGAWTRFLLERHPGGFRTFLGRVASGGEPSLEELLRALREQAGITGVAGLDQAFEEWARGSSSRQTSEPSA